MDVEWAVSLEALFSQLPHRAYVCINNVRFPSLLPTWRLGNVHDLRSDFDVEVSYRKPGSTHGQLLLLRFLGQAYLQGQRCLMMAFLLFHRQCEIWVIMRSDDEVWVTSAKDRGSLDFLLCHLRAPLTLEILHDGSEFLRADISHACKRRHLSQKKNAEVNQPYCELA
jgi:hypothetical protein